MTRTTYEVRVLGEVPEQDLEDMQAVLLSAERASTVLYGVRDQATLEGLLARLEGLGVEVVEVRRVPLPPDAGDRDRT